MKLLSFSVLIAFLFFLATANAQRSLDSIVESVLSEYLNDDDTSSSCTVNASGLNIRSSASTSSSIKKTVPRGSSCTEYSRSGSWSQVSCSGVSGWVSNQYLSCSSSTSYNPKPSTPSTSYTPSSSGCSLMRYSGSGVSGSLVIHKNWRSSMDRLAGYARSCGVTIQITSGFRTSSNVSGAIVTPASKSNHMVGEAIDFNLSYSGGYCNSGCLSGYRTGNIPSQPKCFMDRVKNDSSFRLGVLFSTPDPVHIDSGKNVKDSRGWDAQYQQVQSDHARRCY